MSPRIPLAECFGALAVVFVSCAALSPDPRVQDAEPADASAAPAPADGSESKLVAETLAGLEFRNLGPALMSGRIADIAVNPDRRSTWYVGVGSGGVWKTVNAGTTWTPIFEDQGSYSIGCVTLDPGDPDTVWVGTGENVGGRHVGYGDGVYRSRNGGKSWENVGLGASEHIGNIVVDPRDSNVVYVAAQGPLWSAGGDRGVYKTTDGGATWQQILAGGEYTGANEVRMDPRDPDVLYAALHQRFRNVAVLVDGGPESGIQKSTDGGATWRELKVGLPEEDMGKIGLAVSPVNPDVVYATIEMADHEGGFYRSLDAGESWEKRNDFVSDGTGPHYYQEIFASPHDVDLVYQVAPNIHVTEDGGKTFRLLGEPNKHVDNHAIVFDPADPDYLMAGCDGGLYETWDRGASWKFVANLPVTQFYKVAVDYDEPFYNVYGGTQDNSSQGGPSRTDSASGIRNADWFITLFADGHQPAVDPTNPDVVYSEWQEGNLVRYDRVTGEIVYIQPQPAAGEEWDRFNWDSPILISPHDPARLYYASQRVWRSDDRGDSWRPISGDLSAGRDRLTLPVMGRVLSIDAVWDLFAMSKYGTVTSLSESPLVDGLVYAGTDDGRLQVTEDGGATWRAVEHLPGVADGFFVNDVKADLFDPDRARLVVDHHKHGDFSPYVLESADRGRTWNSIAANLPERHVCWRIVQDHVKPELLFVGTEFGIYTSLDAGGSWIELTGGLPNIPFRDLVVQRRENDLVCASFGRGIWVLDDYSPLRSLSEQLLERDATLFDVRDAWWYVERRPLGNPGKAEQGAAYFMADNPPFGAVFTYYLADGLKTAKDARREHEKELRESGADTPTPGWDALLDEQLEDPPMALLTVRDEHGETVRRLSGPTAAGFHRVAWDLRLPDPGPWRSGREAHEPGEDPFAGGHLAAPGHYTVQLSLRRGGTAGDVGLPRPFEVRPLHDGGALPTAAPVAERAAFIAELTAAQRSAQGGLAAIDDTLERLLSIEGALIESGGGNPALDQRARELERRLRLAREALAGNQRREEMGDPGPISVLHRLEVADMGNRWSTYGPTPTHREALAIARRDLAGLREEIDTLVREDLPALERELDAAGVPWTPGRPEQR